MHKKNQSLHLFAKSHAPFYFFSKTLTANKGRFCVKPTDENCDADKVIATQG
jgi:hypothetical protein